MVNKKGYLKILEAIIAILIVFGLVLYILPKADRNTGALPADLEISADVVLKSVQQDPEFRKIILKTDDTSKFELVIERIDNILGTGSIWKHAEILCDVNFECPLSTPGCTEGQKVLIKTPCYYSGDPNTECITPNNDCGVSNEEDIFNSNIQATNKDVYTKSVTVKSPDVTAENQVAGTNPLVELGCDPAILDCGPETKELRLYFWSKV